MQIRNFSIIAHVDHGKSTLADRFLEMTGTVEKRKMRSQFLDMHPLEREKGITIKMAPVRMNYKLSVPDAQHNFDSASGIRDSVFVLNLIDTPGHVDFSYEVSRALAAVEGAVVLVDATQGIQAQTLANLSLARAQRLAIIPVLNKIDLPSAEIEKNEEALASLCGVPCQEVYKISAKEGKGIEVLLKGIIEKVPPPDTGNEFSIVGDQPLPLRALIFDSLYDQYQGIIAYVRMVNGSVRKGEKFYCMATKFPVEAFEVGVFLPERHPTESLQAGEIGYIALGVKEPEKVRVGDTITGADSHGRITVQPLSGYHEPTPVVFASVFPKNQDEYGLLHESLKKLRLNDAALSFEQEESGVLGRGFRVGFLGMLHMEIVSERLRREHGLELVFTTPSVAFRVQVKKGGTRMIYAASMMPEAHEIEQLEEPWIVGEIVTPPRFLGSLTTNIHEYEGVIRETATLAGETLTVKFEAPLRPIISDFYDVLKSVSQGFASLSYALSSYRPTDLVRLDVVVAGERVPILSEMVPRRELIVRARVLVEKLKELLPREAFAVAVQAVSGGRVIARETIPALKKDVTGYLYGGDRTRKMKLWKKQQRGKKRLKERGTVEISPDVFLKMLKRE